MAPLTLSILLFLSVSSLTANAVVPATATFKYVNQGSFGDYIVEYDASYRTLPIFSSPFQLCFYNTTSNEYTLALRMGTVRSEALMRWVWEANRGNPVRENATFALGADGNLVLADADGRVAWQTNTAGKGVVGFKLLPNGNMVLHDSKGKFIWQSFDSATDTLLVGQSLKAGGPKQLVSRVSESVNENGPYSFVLEPRRLALYIKSPNSPKPTLYFTHENWETFVNVNGSIESVAFTSVPETDEGFAYELKLEMHVAGTESAGGAILGRPKYNSTLSYLRLGIDGNLIAFTFYPKVDYSPWEATFTLFSKHSSRSLGDECELPERCGNFGLCEDSQCVACPSPTGLLGWTKDCKPKALSGCGPSNFKYYKIGGVDHYITKYTQGEGPMKTSDCGNKCTRDCNCLAYFYRTDSSRCWIVYDLKTLTKAENSSHVAYVKAPIK